MTTTTKKWPRRVYNAEFRSGFHCEMTIDPSNQSQLFTVEWKPKLPFELTDELLNTYRNWRNECLQDYANLTGENIACLDDGGDVQVFKAAEKKNDQNH